MEQQAKIASYLKDILGDALYVKPPRTTANTLPSPHELMYKVLIKGKQLPFQGGLEAESDDDADDDELNRTTALTKAEQGGTGRRSPASLGEGSTGRGHAAVASAVTAVAAGGALCLRLTAAVTAVAAREPQRQLLTRQREREHLSRPSLPHTATSSGGP